MKPLLALPLALLLAATTLLAPAAGTTAGAAGSAGSAARPAERREVVLDGVRVRLGQRTAQVVTVRHTHGHHARVTLWNLNAGRGRWTQVARVGDGRTGYGGLVPGNRREQGTGTTPLGTYRLPWTFGTHGDRRAWRLPHRTVRRGDYWVQDNASRYYNRYRNVRQGGFRTRGSERLLDYRRQYEYAVVVKFNWGQVRHRGAGIFLHVNGRGATAGCVSAPRPFLRMLMRRLDPGRRPVVAVGR